MNIYEWIVMELLREANTRVSTDRIGWHAWGGSTAPPPPCTTTEVQPALCKKQRGQLLCIFCIDSLDPSPTPPPNAKPKTKKHTPSFLLSSSSPLSLPSHRQHHHFSALFEKKPNKPIPISQETHLLKGNNISALYFLNLKIPPLSFSLLLLHQLGATQNFQGFFFLLN